MKHLIVFVLLFTMVEISWANRVPEIEEYYIKKTSELLKTRFPEKPFTVFATVDTGDKERLRDDKNNNDKSNNTRLPYLGLDDEVQKIDFWSRTDLPIGTLISELERVEIKVKIDSTISKEELNELKLSLSQQLKLAPGTDSIIIEQMDWTASEKASKRWWIVFGFLGALVAIFLTLYFISRVSVRMLAKSLSEPINEIGKKTQAFANSALNMASDKENSSSNIQAEGEDEKEENLTHGSNLLELRNGGIELLNRNIEILKSPDVEVMEFFERYGDSNPKAMGAILAELDEETLRTVFEYGSKSWWFLALSQPSPMNQASLKILNELDRLRLRRNFDHSNEMINNPQIREAGLIFGRLSIQELVEVFKGKKIEQVDPVLGILPKSFSLAVGKALYPGQWAILLDDSRKQKPLEMNLLEELKKKALDIKPLRKEAEIHTFFRDLDISRYLDVASFRDEREFYMALPADSRIKEERTPFYKILEADPEVVKLMSSDIGVKEWAILLKQAESHEKDKFLTAMPDRLSFMVREKLSLIQSEEVDNDLLRQTKKKALNSFLVNQQNFNLEKTLNNDSVAKDEIQDEDAA